MGLREAESRADDQRDQTPELMSPRNGRCHGLNILGDRKMQQPSEINAARFDDFKKQHIDVKKNVAIDCYDVDCDQ